MAADRVEASGHPVAPGPVPFALFGASALCWPPGEPLVTHAGTALVLPHLDGETPVAELVDDVAVVLGMEPSEIGPEIEADLSALESRGAVAPSSSVPPGTPAPVGEGTVLSDVTDGDTRVVVERLPDGRTRRTATVKIASASSVDALGGLLATRGLSDLLEPGTCTASSLRVGEPMVDCLVQLGDVRTRVRVDHTPSLQAIRSAFGAAILDEREIAAVRVDQGNGQVVAPANPADRTGIGVAAYVIAPYEGGGLPRVYDSWGTRVGRARSVDEVAEQVVRLVREEGLPAPGDGLVVRGLPIESDGRIVLLDTAAQGIPSFHQRVRRLGFNPLGNRRARICWDATVELEQVGPSEGTRRLPLQGVVVLASDRTHDPRAVAGRSLLGRTRRPSPVTAQLALDLLSKVLHDRPVTVVSSADVAELTGSVEALARTGAR